MIRTIVCGLLAAVLGVVAVFVNAWLQYGLGIQAFALVVGMVLGLVRTSSPLARLAAFVIGFVIVWAAYAIQAQFLPQLTVSQAIMVFVVLVLITMIAAVSRGKLPFWAFLLGAAGMLGAYGITFQDNPQDFKADSVATVGAFLFPMALGYLAALLVVLIPEDSDHPDQMAAALPAPAPAPPLPPAPAPSESVGINLVKGQ